MLKFNKHFKEAQFDYKLLKAVDSTWYSTEHPHHFTQIDRIISDAVDTKQDLKVLDGTAHIGGFSLNWAVSHPNHVIDAVEIDSETHEALVHNIKALKLEKQITAVQADVNKYIAKNCKSGQYDFVYLDPPWGGTQYKIQKEMRLSLGGRDVSLIVKDILDRGIAPRVILKIPNNFNRHTISGPYTEHPITRENKKRTDHAFSILVIG